MKYPFLFQDSSTTRVTSSVTAHSLLVGQRSCQSRPSTGLMVLHSPVTVTHELGIPYIMDLPITRPSFNRPSCPSVSLTLSSTTNHLHRKTRHTTIPHCRLLDREIFNARQPRVVSWYPVCGTRRPLHLRCLVHKHLKREQGVLTRPYGRLCSA